MSYRPGDWQCGSCYYNNFASRMECKNCNCPRDSAAVEYYPQPGYQQPYVKGHQFLAGDWYCNCGFANFASRTECKNCGIPKDAAAPPPPPMGEYPIRQDYQPRGQGGYNSKPFLAGDWRCNCGFHNFQSRLECKNCGTAKDVCGGGAEPPRVHGGAYGRPGVAK